MIVPQGGHANGKSMLVENMARVAEAQGKKVYRATMTPTPEQWETRLKKELEKIIGNNEVYLLPPGAKRVYGYSADETTRIAAICVTEDFTKLSLLRSKWEKGEEK